MTEDIMICKLTNWGVCLYKRTDGSYYEQDKGHNGYDFYLDITRLLILMGTCEDPNLIVRDIAKESAQIKDFM